MLRYASGQTRRNDNIKEFFVPSKLLLYLTSIQCKRKINSRNPGIYETLMLQGRSQDIFRGTHNFPNSVGSNCRYRPPPPPLFHQNRCHAGPQLDFHDRRGKFCPRRRRELLGGLGGMLLQKILKPRGSEMLFSAFFMRYFFKNSI